MRRRSTRAASSPSNWGINCRARERFARGKSDGGLAVGLLSCAERLESYTEEGEGDVHFVRIQE